MTEQAGTAEITDHPSPWHLVFMGVSGSGKTTAALAVRDELIARGHGGWVFAEGDEFHPPENIAKMSSGRPLTDDDRWGWLEALAAWTKEHDTAGTPTMLSCSALRRSYRDILRKGGQRTFFVHMTGDKGMLLQRMESRTHFMPPTLLESQLDTLEDLGADEEGIEIDAIHPPARIAAMVLARLDLG